jgi:hypothetical protein
VCIRNLLLVLGTPLVRMLRSMVCICSPPRLRSCCGGYTSTLPHPVGHGVCRSCCTVLVYVGTQFSLAFGRAGVGRMLCLLSATSRETRERAWRNTPALYDCGGSTSRAESGGQTVDDK